MIIPDWRIIRNEIEEPPNYIYNPKPLKQTAGEKIRIDDKQINKKTAEKG